MSKYDDLKKELTELYNKGYKLFESIRTKDDDAGKKYSYFLANYEGWYSKALPVIRQLLPDRLNDFQCSIRIEIGKSWMLGLTQFLMPCKV